MEPNNTYVQCPTCSLKRRNDRPQCKACHEAHIPLHPPGAPKKGPNPSVQQLFPVPGAPKKGPAPARELFPVVPISINFEECKYAEKCTQFGCTKLHPPERPEPINSALKLCKFAITCGFFGCNKQHPEGRIQPIDPITKPCPCEAKFGFCNVKINPNCLNHHKVLRVKKP